MRILVIADDERSFRDALKRLLQAEHEPVAIYEATTGHEAVVLTRQYHPDAVLLDLAMPDCNGLEAARRIRSEFPAARLVICSVHSHPSDQQAALAAGADAFLAKTTLASRLPGLLHDFWQRAS